MKIAIYTPQSVYHKDTIFCKYSGNEFMVNDCNDLVDIIYSCSQTCLPKAIRAKEKYNKPLVSWVWDIPYNWKEWCRVEQFVLENSWRDNAIKEMVKNMKKCDLLISASKFTQKILKNHYGLGSEQMYFYIDTEGIDSVPARKMKEQIIQVSRFAWHKRFEIGILAHSSENLLLMGTGLHSHYGLELQRMADSRNSLEKYNKIEFINNPPRDIVISQIKASKILISPSVFEGWGMTPVEALYCGIPVILSDIEVFHEIYEDTVPYHRVDNYSDLRGKIGKLQDSKVREKIVEQGRKRITEFTPEKFAARFDKMLESRD